MSCHIYIVQCCHFECSPNFIGHNEKMTEMLKQVQHDVLSLFAVLVKAVTLREAIPSEELVSGSTFKSVIGNRRHEDEPA